MPIQTLDNIRVGMFVDFRQLLPNALSVPEDEYALLIKNSDDTSYVPLVSLAPKSGKQRFISLHTWLTAWNLYFRAMIICYPHLTLQ